MKYIIQATAILLLISFKSYSQPVIGMGLGYNIKANTPVLNLQLGAKINKHHLYYNQLVNVTRRSNVPQIIGLRYGYSLDTWQPFIGYDYHIGSSYKANNNPNGFHLAYGISKYFKDFPAMINLGKSGKYITVSIGLYKLID